MKVLTQKFADVVGMDFRKLELDIPINNDDDAVKYCLDHEGLYFETYEISSITIDNNEFHTDPENHSERNYVGITSLYNAADLIGILEAQYAKALVMSDEFSDERRKDLKEKIAEFKRERPDVKYIDEPGTQNAYIRINPDDKVYDKSGQQKWPGLKQ